MFLSDLMQRLTVLCNSDPTFHRYLNSLLTDAIAGLVPSLNSQVLLFSHSVFQCFSVLFCLVFFSY